VDEIEIVPSGHFVKGKIYRGVYETVSLGHFVKGKISRGVDEIV